MPQKFLLTIFFIITGVCSKAAPADFVSPSVVSADSAKLAAHVRALCAITPARDFSHPASLDSAAHYIEAQLRSYGLRYEEQVFTVDGKTYRNIICSIGPADGERIITGAHYDVCGSQPGADDNASGTAALLEIARILGQQKEKIRYRTDLVFYTLEEPPSFRTANMGSAQHAKMIHDQKVKVRAMVCLEMLGYYSEEKKSQHYPIGLLHLFYPGKANYIAVVGKLGQGKTIRRSKRKMRDACDMKVCSIKAPKFIPGIDFSDHLNYWAYGYKAVMITDTAFFRNANYHETSDRPETLHYGKMADAVNGALSVITGL